ncbi:MAG: hypothetical protein P1P71_09530 [Anaerosomatales bacterium]|nr:hypothetical protein [Anaerosomatales bacterium]
MAANRSDAASGQRARRPAPALAPWLLLAAPAVGLSLAVYAILLALMVYPLGDLTPLFVMAFSLLARRWEGVRSRLFGVSALLAATMTVQWGLAYAFLSNAVARSQQQRVGDLLVLYLVELLVLLALFSTACLQSRSSMLRLRMPSSLPDG